MTLCLRHLRRACPRQRFVRCLGSSSPLEELAAHLRGGKRVLFITGAGLSAASGVPTYRGSEDAIWSRYVMEWGTRRKFWENPLRWYNEFWLPTHALTIDSVRKLAQSRGLETVSLKTSSQGTSLTEFSACIQPNAGHAALNDIAVRGDVRIITQNVDGLHLVGMDPEVAQHRYIEAHGRADRYRCPPITSLSTPDTARFGSCVFADEEVLTTIQLPLKLPDDGPPQIDAVPQCPGCGAPVIPAVLFFDEMYTDHKVFAFDRILLWLYLAEVMVFVGTSNSVGLTQKAGDVALRNRIPIYDFNLADSAFPGATSIPGPAEELLPRLQALLQSQLVPKAHYHSPPLWTLVGAYGRTLLWEHFWVNLRPLAYIFGLACIVEMSISALCAVSSHSLGVTLPKQ